MQLQPGCDEAGPADPGPTDLQQGKNPLGVGLQGGSAVGLKPGVIGVERIVEASHVVSRKTRCQLRQAVIRRCDGRRQVLQRLPLEHAQTVGKITFAPGECSIVGQQALCQ